MKKQREAQAQDKEPLRIVSWLQRSEEKGCTVEALSSSSRAADYVSLDRKLAQCLAATITGELESARMLKQGAFAAQGNLVSCR